MSLQCQHTTEEDLYRAESRASEHARMRTRLLRLPRDAEGHLLEGTLLGAEGVDASQVMVTAAPILRRSARHAAYAARLYANARLTWEALLARAGSPTTPFDHTRRHTSTKPSAAMAPQWLHPSACNDIDETANRNMNTEPNMRGHHTPAVKTRD